MAIPIIFGAIAAAAAAGGIASGAKGVKDSKTANRVQGEANAILKKEQDSIEKTKATATAAIKRLGELKLKASSQGIGVFVDLFSQIKDVELEESIGLEELNKLKLSKETIKEMKTVSLDAKDVLSGGIAGVGAGALLGWGTYGGVMALGTASTGTAIGGLSGVAATNATLAWLGGGSLAAGGGGMALGSTVLGGIVAGPALLLAGGIYSAKARTKLNNAYSNLAEAKKIAAEIKLANSELKIIIKNTNQVKNILNVLNRLLELANVRMKVIVEVKNNWKEFSIEEKQTVAAAIKSAQLVKAIIDTPLLTKDGILTKEIRDLQDNQDIKDAYATQRKNDSDQLQAKIESNKAETKAQTD